MKSIIFGSILLLLTGCASISLHVKPQTIHSGGCDIQASLTKVLRQFHGGPLDLKREVFKDSDGNFLVFEEGLLDDDLIFIVTLPDIMKAGFEMDSYKSFSLDRHHDLIIGVGRDNSQVYIVAQSLNEGFSILYSQNYEPLRPLVECLNSEILLPNQPKKEPKNAYDAIKSNWSGITFARHRIAVSKYFEEF
jgi:hypothetical protein